TNPVYTHTYVFDNDFAALNSDAPDGKYNQEDLLQAKVERGICRVLCFSPRHDLTLPEMEVSDILKVVVLWRDQYLELASYPDINYVQIFENKGEMMGCSNPHPHGQIWASCSIPNEPAKEGLRQLTHHNKSKTSLLKDYLGLELQQNDRIVLANEHFVALVPFWAVWPFETMIISKRHFQHLGMMSPEEMHAYAEMIKELTIRYDNLFGISFPYSAGIHQSPTDGLAHKEWHFHMHFYPPLLRSATIKKFMVGYEMLGSPQRDITPEASAERLRALPPLHYKYNRAQEKATIS
ncbi:MAG: galactose-1-phosphate uridylyltransferase, partial [Bacteroidia bacterium]|nr:galactose-1-phosphate uridylyltransferase [Bacteroidia bacterium]